MSAVPEPHSPTILEPRAGAAEATVVMLHGMGTTAATFTPMMRDIQSRMPVPARVVLPDAATRPVTILDGRSVPRWFDLRSDDFRTDEDTEGIEAAGSVLHRVVDDQLAAAIPAEQIAVRGFSQGAALAIRAAATFSSSASPGSWRCPGGHRWLRRRSPPHSRPGRTPRSSWGTATTTRSAHSTGHGRAAHGWRRRAHPVTWRTYPIGHGISPQESRDVARWLAARLSTT